jgi:hypothetical protein
VDTGGGDAVFVELNLAAVDVTMKDAVRLKVLVELTSKV